MELPLYQKHLIEAIRKGRNIWIDDYGKKTYHIRIRKAVLKIDEPTIATLKYLGLILEEGKTVVLTDKGINNLLTHKGVEKKTLYKI